MRKCAIWIVKCRFKTDLFWTMSSKSWVISYYHLNTENRLKENNSDLCQSIKELQESKEEKNRENEELKVYIRYIF